MMRTILILAGLCAATAAAAESPVPDLIAARRWGDAETAVRAALAAKPATAPECYLQLGQICLLSDPAHRADEAVANFEHAAGLRPNDPAVLFWLGRAYGYKAQHAGMFTALSYAGKVKSAFEEAARLEPDNFQYTYALIQFYLEAPAIAGGGIDRARACAAAFHAANDAESVLLRAAILLHEKKWTDTAAALDSVADPEKQPPLVADTWAGMSTNLGFRLLEAKLYPAAEIRFLNLNQRFPSRAAPYSGLGRAYEQDGRKADAAAAYEKALLLRDSANLHHQLGLLYQELGETEKAAAQLNRYLQMDPRGSGAEDARKRLAQLESGK